MMQHRVKEWIWRYGPAEIISLVTTLVPALLVQRNTGNEVAAAFAATWGGNIGYFGTVLLRDMWAMRRELHRVGRQYDLTSFGMNVRLLVIEFGLAEILDSFLVRPALMYYLPIGLGNFTEGRILAKFRADISFYIPAIVFYEWAKRQYRRF